MRYVLIILMLSGCNIEHRKEMIAKEKDRYTAVVNYPQADCYYYNGNISCVTKCK